MGTAGSPPCSGTKAGTWASARCGACAGRGSPLWSGLGRRVVAITLTALGGIAEYAIAPAVSVLVNL